MATYEGVVGGKLKLKGRPLDVTGGKKKKKKAKMMQSESGYGLPPEVSNEEEGEERAITEEKGQRREEEGQRGEEEGQRPPIVDDHRTPAEKRYHEQKAKIEQTRLAKLANKSHRERVEEFNQYLANLSEHYDIPKVGPG